MTVFVTGTFDLLHVEHVRFLQAAKAQGDRLIVGIECDVRVKKLKGPSRPFMGEQDRKEVLEALSSVDEVIILPEQFDTDDQYEQILKDLRADIYCVSQGSPFLEKKQEICTRAGVALRVVRPHNPEYSTTQLVSKICRTLEVTNLSKGEQ